MSFPVYFDVVEDLSCLNIFGRLITHGPEAFATIPFLTITLRLWPLALSLCFYNAKIIQKVRPAKFSPIKNDCFLSSSTLIKIAVPKFGRPGNFD
jgi:hypothetical protein